MNRLVAVYRRRKVLETLVRRDLRVRYARSLLGYLWTIIDPLAMAMIYFVVFALIFRRDDAGHHPYFLFLLAGLLAWQWFNAAVGESSRALIAEAKLVRSTNLPRELWVVRVVVAKGIEFLLSLPVLVAFILFYAVTDGDRLGVNWRLLIAFPLAVVLQFVLLIGIGLVLAPLTALIEDVRRVVLIILRMMFYATPIIYGMDFATEHLGSTGLSWLSALFYLNPLAGILELYRAGLFHADIDYVVIACSVGVTILTLMVGLFLFARLERDVLKEI